MPAIRLTDLIVASVIFFGLLVFCHLAQYSLIIPFLIFFLGIHLYFFKKASIRLFLHLGLLLVLMIGLTEVFIRYFSPHFYNIPVAAIAMLTVLLFNDLQLAFVMAILTSVIATFILGGDFGMMLIFFLGSMAGAFTVKDARTRGQLITAGLFIGVVHIIALILLYPDLELFISNQFLKHKFYPLAFNGFLSCLVVSATLKIFEYVFGMLTNFSLLELSDFNQPLLKRMIMEAPGTYHHSLVVANLAEAASDAIGANALLTRVGAYYHDIGKMAKAEYFTENQMIGANKHDEMEPSMSRLVVLNHVKEGIELAKKYKLNPMIIDFIPQHHGTGLMYFFYQKALEEAKEGEVVSEADYRYPGPKPQTKETAITLMADSVEGATRSLDEPTPTNIEETVKKIVNNKFIDGQLDECNLTLQEINKISSTFTRILCAMYHNRVKYPEKKNGKSSHKNRKQAESPAPQPGGDQETRPENPSA